MRWLVDCIALLVSAALPSPTVSVGNLPWDTLPVFRSTFDPHEFGNTLRAGFRTVLSSRKCDLAGATVEDFKHTTVRFGAFVTPQGQVTRIVVEQRNCIDLERLVAAAALKMAAGAQPTGAEQPGWYRSAVRFDS